MSGKRGALLVGCNYTGTALQLSGCVNDANMTKDILVSRFGWKDSETEVLTDAGATRDVILNKLRDLVARAKSGEINEIWFTYSGHGTQVRDVSGDEADGYDEAIVPSDHATAGFILDDEFYEVFTSQIPKGCNAICIFDCCHSGTMLDLTYEYRNKADRRAARRVREVEGGAVYCLSGCKDNQTSAEAYFERKEATVGTSKVYGGALTIALNSVLESRNYNVTYYQLLAEVKSLLKRGRFNQVPTLSTNVKIGARDIFGRF